MIAVLDASDAVRIVVNPREALQLSTQLEAADLVLAPQLLVAEVANTFWKYFRDGVLDRSACERGLRSSLELVDDVLPLGPLAVEALDLALLARCPAYDMFYLVLARRHGATLLTADETLRRTAHSLGVRTGDAE